MWKQFPLNVDIDTISLKATAYEKTMPLVLYFVE